MINKKSFSDKIVSLTGREKKILEELRNHYDNRKKAKNKEQKKQITNKIDSLKRDLKKINSKISKITKETFNLNEEKEEKGFWDFFTKKSGLSGEITELERGTLRRLKEKREEKEKKKQEEKKKKEKDEKSYLRTASKVFSQTSKKIIDKGSFKDLEDNLIKANMNYTSNGYLSIIFFNTLLAFFISLFLVLFFSLFSIGANPPFITSASGSFLSNLISLLWMVILLPLIVSLFSYFYPQLEQRSVEKKIETELPFATINMAAISGSMIDPSQIFKIIIATGEYPELRKEFTKLMNQINIYGYDFVSALRNSAQTTPSEKLSELYSGLANTITSGGDLAAFFDKRSENLLFEHKMERQKSTKRAETLMDIYISVVIAAPMILMLVLIMMKVSGLGFSLSTNMITIIMVLGVSVINIGFLVFLHLKQK